MKKLFLPLLLIFSATCALAQTHRNEFGIQTDNDSYLGQGSDRYYTDGLFFFFRHALDVKGNDKLQNKVLGFELGQKIFNPQSGALPTVNTLSYLDRPFAGYLYAGANLNYLYKNESNIKLGAQLGIVGPASGGETAQNWVHDNFGFYKTNGWQYQIKNDVELNLSGEYNKLIGRDSLLDLSFTSYANLGTGFTGAGAGLLFRLGAFHKLFNSASTQSSVIASNSGVSNKHEIFFYYKPLFNFIGYDATVQGSLFRSHNDTTSLEVTGTPERIMFSNQLGVIYSNKRWTFDAAAIFHTKDVKEMVRSHQWGTVTALYRFN